MMFDIIVFLFMLVIIYCLGSAAYFLVRTSDETQLAKALTWRIVISLLLFGLLILSFYMGWVTPHEL